MAWDCFSSVGEFEESLDSIRSTSNIIISLTSKAPYEINPIIIDGSQYEDELERTDNLEIIRNIREALKEKENVALGRSN